MPLPFRLKINMDGDVGWKKFCPRKVRDSTKAVHSDPKEVVCEKELDETR